VAIDQRIADGPQPLARLIGVEIVEATKAKVVGKLKVRPEICTTFDTLHGGAIMAFADTLGATGAFLNLPPGAGTTTMESKTNFIGAAKVGSTVTGESTPIHVGKTTSVWTTRITRDDGKLVAVVTQTQIVLT
jgi:1,4-dihydroxy-2-naphthoyl-CoA hydrolase